MTIATISLLVLLGALLVAHAWLIHRDLKRAQAILDDIQAINWPMGDKHNVN